MSSNISYKPLIEGMTWSYSRITCFEMCPYQWYLKYLYKLRYDNHSMFFSTYGTLMHELLAKYFRGEADPAELLTEYFADFYSRVPQGGAPSGKLYNRYLLAGAAAINRLPPADGTLAVEKKVRFSIGGKPFIGYIDRVYEDTKGRLVIEDHKSKALKPRSHRKKPTKSDEELDLYLRQLYLYSIPIEKEYGKPPDTLKFNCYRTGQEIHEKFSPEKLGEVKAWAEDAISGIEDETRFAPDIDLFKCRYLCDVHNDCELSVAA